MSQVIKRRAFIAQFLEIIRKDLQDELPEEDFETGMLEKAWEIVADKVRHIRKAVL
jgi:hypothetical protein